MNLDIPTLAIVSGLTFLAQAIAVLLQYSVNRTYAGVKWWLAGSALWAVGAIFMPLVNVPALIGLALIANPLVVFGQICLYVGMRQFLAKQANLRALASIFVITILLYYFFIFARNDISARAFVLLVSIASISIKTASDLFLTTDMRIRRSARFTAIVFLAYGIFEGARIFWLVTSPPIVAYSDQGAILELSFLVPIFVSLLWTFGFIIMMNQRLNAENRAESEKRQLIFNTSPDAAIISRLSDGAIVDVNAGFLRMSGYTRSEVIGNTTKSISIWQRAADRESFVNELQAKGQISAKEFSFQRKDGSLLTGNMSANVIPIEAVPHIVSVVHDISARKQAEEAVLASEELYRTILNASPDDITITDLNGQIQVLSPAAEKMFGYEIESDHVIGSQILDYVAHEDRDRARANILSVFKGTHTGAHEYRGVRKDGTVFDIEVNSGLIRNADGQPARLVFIIRDITARKLADQQIQDLVRQLEQEKNTAQHSANTDSLTGLANRRYFDEAIALEFQRLKRSGGPLSLIMLDVDHFKQFNDRYGHLAGDNCLRQIAGTLKTFARRVTDTAARYGGEEFVVILTDTEQAGVMVVAEGIRKAVAALAIPHADSDVEAYVTVSLGVATVHPSGLATAAQIVGLADEALYRSKEGGRNRTSVTTEVAAAEKNENGVKRSESVPQIP